MVGVGGLAGQSAAAADSPPGILTGGFDVKVDRFAFFRGVRARFGGWSRPPTVATLADRARNEFNANNEHWIDYGNFLVEETDASALGSTVVDVEFAVTRSRWPTRDEDRTTNIVVDYDDALDRFVGLEWHDGAADDAEYHVRLENHAAENAADELQTFRRRFIDEDGNDHQVPDDEYLNALAGEYWNAISFGSDETRNVLEVFIGEVS